MERKKIVLGAVAAVVLFLGGAGLSEFVKQKALRDAGIDIASTEGSDASLNGAVEAAPVESAAKAPSEFWLKAIPSLAKGYNAATVVTEATAFNAAEVAKCPAENAPDLCEGAIRLKPNEGEPYFSIFKRKVDRGHTERLGIDDGQDSFSETFFTKVPSVLEIAELAGPVHILKGGRFVVSVPAAESCLGKIPDGSVSLYDLQARKEVFANRFKGETILEVKVTDQSAASPNAMFEVAAESPVSDPESCEVGTTVMKSKEVLALTCNEQGENCSLMQKSYTQERGCQDIGSCD